MPRSQAMRPLAALHSGSGFEGPRAIRPPPLKTRSLPEFRQEGRLSFAVVIARETLGIPTVHSGVPVVVEPVVAEGAFLPGQRILTTGILGMVDTPITIVIEPITAFGTLLAQLVDAPVGAENKKLTGSPLPYGHSPDIVQL